VYVPTAARVGYNTDEGQFIAASEYFDIAVIRHELTGPVWAPNYYVLTQPMLSRFILGAGIRFAGLTPPPLDIHHREAEVNPSTRARYLQRETYRDERRLAEERRIDRPSNAVLQAARSPMIALATLATGLLYLVGRLLAGPLAGLVAAAIALWNPTMLTLLPRAHAEAPLYFGTLASLLLGLLAARAIPGRASIWLGVGCGLMTGLAISAKLTAVLLAAALLAYAGVAFLAWLPGRALLAAVAWRWSMLAALVSMLVMVAVNPFLYPNPPDRLRQMFEFRQQEMFGQAALSENEALPPGLSARMPVVLERTLVDLATLHARLGPPLDLPLIVLGLLTLGYQLARSRSRDTLLGPHALLLLCCVVTTLGLAWNIGIDWARYYMPLLTLSSVLVGIGTVSLVNAVLRVARAT
jgi:4-amino-4-deoxy-L-arabinose transferase-like glycosyltransferase